MSYQQPVHQTQLALPPTSNPPHQGIVPQSVSLDQVQGLINAALLQAANRAPTATTQMSYQQPVHQTQQALRLPMPYQQQEPLSMPYHQSTPLPLFYHQQQRLSGSARRTNRVQRIQEYNAFVAVSSAGNILDRDDDRDINFPPQPAVYLQAPLPMPYQHQAPLPMPYQHQAPPPMPYHHQAPQPMPYQYQAPQPMPCHHQGPPQMPYHHQGAVHQQPPQHPM